MKGRELCFTCHAEENLEFEVPHKVVTTGKECLSCHVSHAGKNQKLLLAEEPELCYGCHEQTKEGLKITKPHKPFAEGKCSDCHDSHGSNITGMLRARMDLVCYGCHVDAELQFTKTNTHKPVIDGSCNRCHKSHGATEEKLLLAPADDSKLCVDCHGEMMKEAVKGSNHEFFKNGKCLKCHDAHASNNIGMIVSKQGFLCYSCHGTDPDKEVKEIKSKHSPVVAGECTGCHNPHKAKLQSLLLAGYPDLCLSCHNDLKVRMYGKDEDWAAAQGEVSGGSTAEGNRIYVHSISDLEKCQTCHRPHFSDELALIVEPIQLLCNKCHDYNEPSFRKGHINIAAKVMDCRNCHDPHTSKDPTFFREEIHKPFVDRTCKDCHIVEKP
jgi:predicted CXXCH cytochrome family protein